MGQNTIGNAALLLSVNAQALESGLGKAKSMIQGWKPSGSGFNLGGIASSLTSTLSGALSSAGTWGMAASAALSAFTPVVSFLQSSFGGIGSFLVDEFNAGWSRVKDIAGHAKGSGMDLGQFSELAYAATSAGVSLDELNKTIHLTEHLTFQAGHGSKEAGDKVKMLGLDFESLNRMPTAEKLGTIGDALNKLSSTDRLGVAMEIIPEKHLGTVLPLLLKGKEGITGMANEFKKLGLSLDDNAGKQMASWGKAMNHAKQLWDGVWNKLASTVAPVIASVAERLENGIKRVVDVVGPPLRWIFTFISNNASQMEGLFSAVEQTFKVVWDSIVSMLPEFDTSSIADELDSVNDVMNNLVKYGTIGFIVMRDEVVNVFSDMGESVSTILGKLTESFGDMMVEIGKNLKKIKGFGEVGQDLQDMGDKTLDLADQLKAHKEIHFDVKADVKEAMKKFDEIEAKRKALGKGQKEALPDMEALKEAGKILEDNPITKFSERMTVLNKLLDSGLIKMGDFAREADKAKKALVGGLIDEAPLAQAENKIKQLQDMLNAKVITEDEFAMGAAKAVSALEAGIGNMKPPKMMVEGSQEAVRTIIAAQTAGRDTPAMRLERLVQAQKQIQEDQLKEQKEMVKALKDKQLLGVM